MTQRLKKVYQKFAKEACFCRDGTIRFGDVFVANIHEIPRVKKIVVNRGLGAQTLKMVEIFLSELSRISAQSGVVTVSRNSVAGFKIRAKVPVGVIVTLRGDRIYAFFDRLVNLRLPRIRDFRGLSVQNFDADGNYNMGLDEQLMFPEISYENIEQLSGMGLSIATSSTQKNNLKKHLSQFLLEIMGIPFGDRVTTLFASICT